MNHHELNLLIDRVSDSPELIAYLEEHFQEADAHLTSLLLSEADERAYPLRQWVEALQVFELWLEARGLSLPLENQIGYITCSADAGSAYPTLIQLPAQVADMLENYGCDAAVEK